MRRYKISILKNASIVNVENNPTNECRVSDAEIDAVDLWFCRLGAGCRNGCELANYPWCGRRGEGKALDPTMLVVVGLGR